jgi:hypothetical protein
MVLPVMMHEAKQSMALRGDKVDCFRVALRQTGRRCGKSALKFAVICRRKRLALVTGHGSELNRRELQWRPSTP